MAKFKDFLKINIFSGSYDSFAFSLGEGFLITTGLAAGEGEKSLLLSQEQ